MNGVPTSALGSAAVVVAGTIWSSKTTIAETRKAMLTARWGSRLPVVGELGITIRCSVPPGRRCAMVASCWSIMAACGLPGLKSRPESTLTRSAVTPNEPSRPEMVATWVAEGLPCGPGRTAL